eukprot:2811551-Rhodomonas_salina.1
MSFSRVSYIAHRARSVLPMTYIYHNALGQHHTSLNGGPEHVSTGQCTAICVGAKHVSTGQSIADRGIIPRRPPTWLRRAGAL